MFIRYLKSAITVPCVVRKPQTLCIGTPMLVTPSSKHWICTIDNPSDGDYIKAVLHNGMALKYIPKRHQNLELCFMAYLVNPRSIRYCVHDEIRKRVHQLHTQLRWK